MWNIKIIITNDFSFNLKKISFPLFYRGVMQKQLEKFYEFKEAFTINIIQLSEQELENLLSNLSKLPIKIYCYKINKKTYKKLKSFKVEYKFLKNMPILTCNDYILFIFGKKAILGYLTCKSKMPFEFHKFLII